MKSLELLEARQENAAMRVELKRLQAAERRLRWYVKTQMQPLVRMGIQQGGRIKTLERQLKRRDAKIAAMEKDWKQNYDPLRR